MTLIQLDHIDLVFRVRRSKQISLKEYLLHHWFRQTPEKTKEICALKDVTLHIGEGERIGIIGHNGAGKSSLLRLLAGVYSPHRGRRVVNGRISSLFDIALGFEWEANGWENIAFRGYLQGETPRSIRDKIQPIAEFSELGEFLDMPVRYYSSGMLVRLAFSIATAINPEILLVDEVLSTGDLAFQAKARERMRSLISQAKAVIVVSHDLSSLAELCDRVIWLDHGRIRQAGPTQDVIDAYTHHSRSTLMTEAA